MIFDIKKIYILSGLSLAGLVLVSIISNVSVPTDNKQQSIDYPIPTPIIVVNKVVKKVTKYVTPAPNINNGNTVTTTAKPQANSPVTIILPTAGPTPACVVTVDGVKYNVSVFRNIHSGGDIFRCGADVSSEFWGRHSQRQLNQMQQYRI